MNLLAAKRAIVTGASSGIGAEIATAVAEAGAEVLCVGRDRSRLEQVISRPAGTGRLHAAAIDLNATGSSTRVVRRAVEVLGGIDILVHSAGIFEAGPFRDTDAATLDRQWEVHVRAPYRLTREAVPSLNGHGSVIFVSSVCGRRPFPEAVAYCTTKAASEMMAKTLAVELAPVGIRVNTIAPGWVKTPMNAELLADPEYAAAQVALTPTGRLGVPADVAPAAVFLASDAASYINGALHAIDGGFPALS